MCSNRGAPIVEGLALPNEKRKEKSGSLKRVTGGAQGEKEGGARNSTL